MILLGCILYGWSMVFLANISTIPGNLMGIAATCNILFGWPPGLVNIILSLPTLFIGTMIIGKKMLVYTTIAMIGMSGMTDLFVTRMSYLPTYGQLLPTLLAAIIMGIGCGLILFAGATTGGTTIIGRLILRKYDRLSLGNLLIIMDGIIIAVGAAATQNLSRFIYSIIFEITVCKTIDVILYLLRKIFPAAW